MSAFHDTSVLKEACDRLVEGMKLEDAQERIAALETQNAALREVALEAAEYLELPHMKGAPLGRMRKHIAAKLRAALEKCDA